MTPTLASEQGLLGGLQVGNDPRPLPATPYVRPFLSDPLHRLSSSREDGGLTG